MTKLTVGIVDYGIGNHASVKQALHRLDLRCRVSDSRAVLEACDLLLLPGVGAFRPAMQALRSRLLDEFILQQAGRRKPILGICLGMQLLTDASHEDGYMTGLGLIPGETVPLQPLRWHIGWNTVEQTKEDPLFQHCDGRAFFFNHSYAYRGPEQLQYGKARLNEPFACIVRNDRTVGVQFHPEKSQQAGHALLRQIVQGLCDA